MEISAIESAMAAAGTSLADGGGLSGTGFWPAVASVKRTPDLVERYADRIAAIDHGAFENWAAYKVPLHPGTTLMGFGTLMGLGLVWAAYYLEEVWALLSFFAGVGVLLVTTHGLAHLLVGTIVGIGFTGWFIGTWKQPQPGVKVDYSTYLRVTASKRAWMHAAGAITTKLLPFLLIGAAVYSPLPGWTIWVLIGIGVVASVTDIVWSTKSSDWKKYRREMEFAQTS